MYKISAYISIKTYIMEFCLSGYMWRFCHKMWKFWDKMWRFQGKMWQFPQNIYKGSFETEVSKLP